MGLVFTNLSLTNLTSVGEPTQEVVPNPAFEALVAPRTQSMTGNTSTVSRLSSPDLYVSLNRSNGSIFFWPRNPIGTLNVSNSNAAFFQTGYTWGTNNITFTQGFDSGPVSYADYYFKRSAGAFDMLTWNGNSSSQTLSHNLGVVPEMAIVKCTSSNQEGALTADWWTYIKGSDGNGYRMKLNTTGGNSYTSPLDNSTASVFSPYEVGYSSSGGALSGNTSGRTYIGMLFATKANVSYVGSYVGNNTARTINCGFTQGAALVLIKPITTGSWYFFDSARGITAGNDPFMLTTPVAAETTTTNLVSADPTGFGITANTTINNSGTTYVVLALSA